MREFKRHLRIHFWIALIMYAIFAIMRLGILYSYGLMPFETAYLPENTIIWFHLGMSLVISVFISFILTINDIFIISRIAKHKSFAYTLVISLFMSVLVLLGVMLVIDSSVIWLLKKLSNQLTIKTNITELGVTAFFLIVSIILARIVIEIDRKLGPGNLWKFMTGRFHHPREEERIFMFIDLEGSTTIAEKIGHFKFSELLRDCFNDLSIVDKYHAEIYQYVGDEVVISWPVSESKNYEQFLSAFFAFQNKLISRKEYYLEKYDLQPRFKAGVHAGFAIVTEVGEIKREITYHGDTLNTAARIQSMCNILEASLLVSESLYELVKPYSPHTFQDAGCIGLKGKKEEVRLFKVNQ